MIGQRIHRYQCFNKLILPRKSENIIFFPTMKIILSIQDFLICLNLFLKSVWFKYFLKLVWGQYKNTEAGLVSCFRNFYFFHLKYFLIILLCINGFLLKFEINYLLARYCHTKVKQDQKIFIQNYKNLICFHYSYFDLNQS